MKCFSLSVVLPAYNEEKNIEKTVKNCLNYLETRFASSEVIVVNDGSSDSTRDIVLRLSSLGERVKLVNHHTNHGYGSALRSGFDSSVMDYIFFMDSDGQFDINELDLLMEKLEVNTAVIGYRKKRSDSIIRLINQKLYRLYIELNFGLGVRDVDCAFKIFPRKSYELIKPVRSDGALFNTEFLIKLKKSGLNIKEVGISHYPREFGSQTGANLSVILKMFKESWKFRSDLR